MHTWMWLEFQIALQNAKITTGITSCRSLEVRWFPSKKHLMELIHMTKNHLNTP